MTSRAVRVERELRRKICALLISSCWQADTTRRETQTIVFAAIDSAPIREQLHRQQSAVSFLLSKISHRHACFNYLCHCCVFFSLSPATMKPFSIFYVTNGQELDTNSNPVQADVGNNGFCLTFTQFWNATNSCVCLLSSWFSFNQVLTSKRDFKLQWTRVHGDFLLQGKCWLS